MSLSPFTGQPRPRLDSQSIGLRAGPGGPFREKKGFCSETAPDKGRGWAYRLRCLWASDVADDQLSVVLSPGWSGSESVQL